MFKVNVPKADLIETLQKNRNAHREIFLAAQNKYKERAIAEFLKRVEAVRNNDPFTLYVQLPIPEDHTDDYDRAIKMLEMATDKTVELNEQDFGQYVQDDWGWRQAWVANTASYVS